MIIELLIKCCAWTPGSELQGKTKLYNGSRSRSTSDSAATYFSDYFGQSCLRPGFTRVSLGLHSAVLMGAEMLFLLRRGEKVWDLVFILCFLIILTMQS